MLEVIVTLALITLALLGVPLFVIIVAAALFGFYQSDITLSVISIEIYRLTNTPLLIALPLFTFAGYLLSRSNTSDRLVALTRAMIGWMPGELMVVTLITSALFTAFTGATGITIVALGALLLPALQSQGYSQKFNLGMITSAGSLGVLLPPSLPLILYVVIVQQLDIDISLDIRDMFIAGILPTLLMISVMLGLGLWMTRHTPKESIPFSFSRLKDALYHARWEIPLPFVILGGIYSGFFALSEAAVITVIYVVITEVFIYKEISTRQVPQIMKEAMTVVGGIMLILGVSLAFTNYLVDAEIPTRLFEWTRTHIDNKYTFLLLLNLFLLVLGAMLDIFSALIIMVPLIVPMAIGYGIHPVHLGVVFLANLQVGYLTPPVGMNLFIASYRFSIPIQTIYRTTLPFVVTLLLCVLIITYWPALSLAWVN